MPTTRVCHLSKYYPPAPGGIETHVRTLAIAQAEAGASVRVFCVNHAGSSTVVERDGPVEVTRFGRAASGAKLEFCPGLPAAIARVEADVLHLQVPNPTMILALLKAGSRLPMVVTYQSDVIRQRLRAAAFRPLERLLYRKASAVLTTSPGYAGGSPFLARYRDRTEVVPLGIDLAPYLEPTEAHRVEAAAIRARHPGPIWLGCGRMVYYKGFSNAIRAMRRAPGTLILIGGGPDLESLREEARASGVANRVVFAGNLPHYHDLIPYYLAAEAFWFPSNARSEAYGLVQVEAMACGVPVINAAIPHSGVAWVSRDGETGLTVAVDDPEALADAAIRLAGDRALRDRLGAAARERATLEFDHRLMARRTLAVYDRVLARIPAAPEPPRTPAVAEAAPR